MYFDGYSREFVLTLIVVTELDCNAKYFQIYIYVFDPEFINKMPQAETSILNFFGECQLKLKTQHNAMKLNSCHLVIKYILQFNTNS